MTTLKNRLQGITSIAENTIFNLDSVGIRRLIYFSIFLLSLFIYTLTGNIALSAVKDLSFLLFTYNVITGIKPAKKDSLPEKRESDKVNITFTPNPNNSDDGKKYISAEQLITLLDALILDEVKKENCSNETIAVLEDMKNKIAAGAGITLSQAPVGFMEVPTLNELMDKFKPEKTEDTVEKADNEKTADEIISEVDDLFAAEKRKTPFNKLFMF